MTEIWETIFRGNKEMWGWQPVDSAYKTLELFKKHDVKKILIPGFGYGRNAKVFSDDGFDVTGIEIAETAIKKAKKQFGDSIKLLHGSVSSMPFDNELYDGIFSYSLLHLLSPNDRTKFINDCYNQLKPDGYMVFVTISKMDFRFGKGKEMNKDTFEVLPGLNLFFHDSDSIKAAFGHYGLIDAKLINESEKNVSDHPSQIFWYVICKKQSNQNDLD